MDLLEAKHTTWKVFEQAMLSVGYLHKRRNGRRALARVGPPEGVSDRAELRVRGA
jgi:hypothetical protein